MNDLWIAHYELQAAGPLNAVSGRTSFRGFLLRAGSGFGCVHPWPELGDPSAEECLANPNVAIVQRALACAEADGCARERGESLFQGLQVPRSHATLPQLSHEALESALEAKFSMVKVKARGELRELREMMKEYPALRWRVDFNGAGELSEIADVLYEVRGQIDFLEDPIPYEPALWERWSEELGIALANDRAVERDRSSDVIVIKPALHDMAPLLDHPGRKVVTSYMDHPLGQSFAAYEAARHGIGEVCGLQTHGLFTSHPFSEWLGEVAPAFHIPEGTGLGFDELLEGLDWKKLS